ncbi:2-oxoglutarate and iron-dependent oxygenase domain-containing protein 3-like [Copidosoma floridanum]|uniref:2-oxoglutarate and iron-dependent oxygenase domain-containing protein 3-like n=1 Tax=Copidosoma floridanum TaxID=29053 RepID=UPI0006C9B609|nr:2-oxoglutarate and iron-dependent oxygenase domain-containing protein 3-like [Copidosoma floridanum]
MVQETVRKRKNDALTEKKQATNDNKTESDAVENEIKPKYGPHVTFSYQKVWTRCVLILAIMFIVWYQGKNGKEIFLAKQKQVLINRSVNVECSNDYRNEMEKFPGCVPKKCGRVVSDKLVSGSEVDVLLKLAENTFKLAGSDGGASILDLQSGALSKGSKFINVYALDEAQKIFDMTDFVIYKVVKTKIQHAIANHFGIDVSKIHLTKPTFFSQITNLPAKSIHDEYWHPHVDKETYESFHYTSLLYLSDYGRDFEGGRFIFIDTNNVNTTIEPRKGRVSMFTSGSENLHAVEKVTSGTRYALTVSFTCDSQFAVSDPNLNLLKRTVI